MKKIIFVFAALAMMAVACQRVEIDPQDIEEPGTEVSMIYEIISGGSETSTKVTIDADAKFAWTVGDNVAVHVSDGDSHKYVFTSDAGASGASVAKKSASFTVAYPAGYSRDAFVVFPSTIVSETAANYGQSGSALDVTLPASYTLAQVSGETSPCPMIADNTGANWDFNHLCGMLRLTVNGIPSDATGIIIQFPGKKVNGVFSIATPVTPGTSTIVTGAPADGEDKITVTFDAGISSAIVNIPLPTGDYEDVFITPVGSSTKVAAVRHIKAGGYTATRARAKKLTTTMVSFSVSNSKKVVFAPGNLQATTSDKGANWAWHFAAHQYDYIGNAASNNAVNGDGTVSTNGTVDLFGFSTPSTYYGIHNSTEATAYSGDFKDWGNNLIGAYQTDNWSTLTKAEWMFLTGRGTCRNNGGTVAGVENALCTKATINTDTTPVNGFIIFPDYYSCNTTIGVTWNTGTIQHGTYDNSTKGWGASITTTAWESLESEGCVFLPLGFLRYSNIMLYRADCPYDSYKDPRGHYASNTTEASNSFQVLLFRDDGYDPQNAPVNKAYGVSVRLVHVL